MFVPRIMVIAGSARRDSHARRLARACIAPLQASGAHIDAVELADYAAPLYHGDLEDEQGLPAVVIELQRKLAACDGLLVVSPEYNGSITPLLKNTLDWCSRPNPADPARSGGAIYAGRAAALVGSSPGTLGGMRALFHVRDILGYLGMQVIPQQLAVAGADTALDAEGRFIDRARQDALQRVLDALVDTARRLRA